MILASIAAVLVAWSGAFVIAIGVLLAVSLDNLRDLVWRAVRVSAAAMWLPPAFLLVSERTVFSSAIGFLLIANTMRLLVSKLAIRNPIHRRRRLFKRDLYFRDVVVHEGSFSKQTVPVIVGALAVHLGLCAVVAGFPLAACLLVSSGSAIWTLAWVAWGANRTPNEPKLLRSLLSVIATLALATWISVGQARFASPGIVGAWRYVAYGTRLSVPKVRTSAARLVDPKKVLLEAKDLVPGVILRPESMTHEQDRVVLAPSRPGSRIVSRPLTIEFTGEYHLFPTSSGQVQSDSVVYTGTPLDAAYVNMGGGSIETEAYQPLHPPIDFTNCARLELSLRHGERSPSSATVYLVLGREMEEIGSQIFGFEPSAKETLEYNFSSVRRDLLVKAIRVVFHCDPSHNSQSTRVAVEKFKLIPRAF